MKNLQTYNDQEVSMSACEHRYIHRDTHTVWLVEAYSKVTLSTQQKQDKHTDVHQTHTRCEQNENRLTEMIYHQTRKANTDDSHSKWEKNLYFKNIFMSP